MAGAEGSAAPPIRGAFRSSVLVVATAIVLAGGGVAGCEGTGAGRPIAASPGATGSVPAGELPRDAVRILSEDGPVQVVHGASSTVIYSARSGIDARDLARRVDAAVPAAVAFWRTPWHQPVIVLIPASLAHWQALTGLPPDPDVAAVSLGASSVETAGTRPQVSSPTGSGEPVAGQRIVVNPGAYRRLSDAGRSVVLRHEVAHLVSASRTPPGMPSWLVEGTADVVGFGGSGIPVPRAAEELAAQVRRSGPPARLPTDADYSGGSSSVAYEEGWLACRLIDREKGPAALRALYDGVAAELRARSGPVAGGQATSIVSDALRRATGWTLGDFLARWRADVQLELGPAA